MKIGYVIAIFVFSAGLIIAPLSFGLPRFAANVEQKCNLCHISPTGGGMRNDFGSQYFAFTEMAVHKTPLSDLSTFQPQVSEMISFGMDMRTQYIYDELGQLSTFFQMEGNLYLNAQLDKRFSVTLKKGLYDGFEIFGMGYVLPSQGYFRVGKFQPSYGWRFADHTSFVRERMLWPPNSTDTGMEFGIYPHGISANVGFFNGTGGTFDNDKGKAVSSRLEIRKHIGKLGFALGGSYYFNDHSNNELTMAGPFYYLTGGKLILLGELDWLDNEASGQPGITSFATTQKLAYMIKQGIWLELFYDYFDPDTDIKSGTVSRYGIGLDYFPFGFLEFEPNLKFYDDSYLGDEQYILFNTQFHFFF
jgi:hypothetical protein